MKTKNISILLLILLFAGASLFNSARAFAQVDATDCGCSQEEMDLQRCYDIGGYLIQPYFNEDYPDPIGAGKWPIINGGTKEWRYKVCSNATKKECRSLSALSYVVFLLPWQEGETGVDYYLSSIPPGASLLLPGDLISPKDKDKPIPDLYSGLKVNPAVNCGNSVGSVVSIFTNLEPQAGYCADVYMVLSDGAYQSVTRGVAFDFVPPEPVRSFCDGRLVVYSDPCDLEVLDVKIDGVSATPSITAQICDQNGDYCDPLQACGGGLGGCYICIDKPMYIDGDTLWYRP